jgi:hypothetical protein
MRKILSNFVFFTLLFAGIGLKAQTVKSGTFDTSLQELTDKLAEKLMKYNTLKMGVWDLSDLDGGVSPIGKYVADDVAINLSDKFHIVNRNQLNTLIKENRLSAEGFINQATLKQVKKLSDIDVIITGTISVLSQNIKITLQALDSDGNILGGVKGEVYRNADVNELYGINNTVTNRGFNRPVGSNEQFNNPKTVDDECAQQHLGDYCFFNSSNSPLRMTVAYCTIPMNWKYPNYTITRSDFILKPGESKCIPAVVASPRARNTFKAEKDVSNNSTCFSCFVTVDEGSFTVEQCKSKTYQIK